MTLGEFYEREYAFEYKNELYLHGQRIIIHALILQNIDSKKDKIPTLKEIYHLPLLDKEYVIGEELTDEEYIKIRPSAQDVINNFKF
jgi:hypothetical protein